MAESHTANKKIVYEIVVINVIHGHDTKKEWKHNSEQQLSRMCFFFSKKNGWNKTNEWTKKMFGNNVANVWKGKSVVLSKCEKFSYNEKSNLFSHDISDKNGICRETEFTFKFIFTCMKNSEKKKQPNDGKLNFVAVRKSKMYNVETSQTFVTFILVYCCRNFNSVFFAHFFSEGRIIRNADFSIGYRILW